MSYLIPNFKFTDPDMQAFQKAIDSFTRSHSTSSQESPSEQSHHLDFQLNGNTRERLSENDLPILNHHKFIKVFDSDAKTKLITLPS